MCRALKIKRFDKHFSVLADLHKAYNKKQELLFSERIAFNTIVKMKNANLDPTEIKQAEDYFFTLHSTLNGTFLDYYAAVGKAKAKLASTVVDRYIELLEGQRKS